MGTPPGGPEDIQPPYVASVVPRTDSAGVGPRPEIVLTFSEKVQKDQVRAFVEINPDPGPLSLSWDGPRLRIVPDSNLLADITYRVRVKPGVTDMHRVKSDSSFVTYFSTGAQPDAGEITGKITRGDTAVFGAVVRAAWMKDSSLVYDTYSDSSGAYRLPYLRTGGYRLLAFSDLNRNRRYDYTREPGASALSSVIFEPVTVDFAIETADTTAPVFRSVEAIDSLRVRLIFDDPLDTLQILTADNFSLRTPDSTGLAVPLDSARVEKSDRSHLLLYPAQPLVQEKSYYLGVRGITNRAGLTLESASRSFTFKPAQAPRAREGRERP